MIDATKFAQPRPGSYRIGVFPAKIVADELRRIADRIEAKELHIEQVQTSQLAINQEWLSQCLFIEFHEKDPKEAERRPPEPIIRLDYDKDSVSDKPLNAKK